MIPVAQKPEPAQFDAEVRQPGLVFLQEHPEGRLRPLWARARRDLHREYSSICAYTCQLVVGGEVDHFLPASKRRDLAYEWSNYRLSCSLANRTKGAKVGLVDPFDVEQGWFAMTLPQCDIVSGPNVPEDRAGQVQATIAALNLNCEQLVEWRHGVMVEFRDGHVSLDHLRRCYPFHAVELERQGSGSGGHSEEGIRTFVSALFRDKSV